MSGKLTTENNLGSMSAAACSRRRCPACGVGLLQITNDKVSDNGQLEG